MLKDNQYASMYDFGVLYLRVEFIQLWVVITENILITRDNYNSIAFVLE